MNVFLLFLIIIQRWSCQGKGRGEHQRRFENMEMEVVDQQWSPLNGAAGRTERRRILTVDGADNRNISSPMIPTTS